MPNKPESIEESDESRFEEPPRRSPWVRRSVIVAILAVVAIFGYRAYASYHAKAKGDPNQYMVSAVSIGTVKKTVTATGTLQPWTVVDIKSKAGGLIESLPVTEGTIVKKGQLIAEIDPSDTLLTFNQAKADVSSNKAQVEQARKNLELQEKEAIITIDTAKASLNSSKASAQAAKANYDSALNQSEVQPDLTNASLDSAHANLVAAQAKLDQLKKASNPQATAAAKASLNQAKANLDNAKTTLNRQNALFDKGFVAKSELDTAQTNFDVAQETYNSALEKMNTLNAELDADIASQQAQVNQVAAALKTAEANKVQIQLTKQSAASAFANYKQTVAGVRQAEQKLKDAQAQLINISIRKSQIDQAVASGARADASLTNAQTQLDQTRVPAPSAGIILQKYVEQGTMITSGQSFNSTGTSIVQMGDISRMYVDVQVDETDIASVDMGQDVDITFDAYPTTPFQGKVIKINPQAVVDSNVTTIHVRVEVDNSVPSFRLLKPAMNASCEFIVGKKEDVLNVPNEALKTEDSGDSYVEIATGGKPAPAEEGEQSDPNTLVDIKIIKRKVEIGLEGNDATEILKGLKEGERVITQTIEPSGPIAPGGNPFGRSMGPGRK